MLNAAKWNKSCKGSIKGSNCGVCEAYKAQKQTQGGNRGTERDGSGRFTAGDQNGHLPKPRTRDVIAKEFGVGVQTVARAEHFLDGLNEANKVSPGIKEAILTA